jgi:hypothetical protein
VLDRPKQDTKPMRFNLFKGNKKADPDFYNDGVDNMASELDFDIDEVQKNIIDDLDKAHDGKE